MQITKVKQLPEFTTWINNLPDKAVRGAVLSRIKRLEYGLQGDAKSVGGGVSELRIHLGAGWRLYYTQCGADLIILLVGGSKSSQSKDIQLAKKRADILS